jgi:hypothetical protein
MGNLISRKKHIIQSTKNHLLIDDLIDELNKKEQERIINLSKSQLKNNEYTKNDIITNLHNYVQLYNLKSINKFLLLKEFILELENS